MNPPADPTPPPMPPTPPGGPANTPSPIDGRPQYEFDDAQNKVIDSLASSLMWVGIPLTVAGILNAMYAVIYAINISKHGGHVAVAALVMAVAAVLFFFLATWVKNAAIAFTRVTHTTGYDVTHLMSGVQNLAKLFGMLAAFVQAYLILLAVMLLILIANSFFGWLQ